MLEIKLLSFVYPAYNGCIIENTCCGFFCLYLFILKSLTTLCVTQKCTYNFLCGTTFGDICTFFKYDSGCLLINLILNLTCVLFLIKRKLIPKSVFQAVTEKNFETKDFRASLENGVLLCDLINKLKPGVIKKINRLSTPIAGLREEIQLHPPEHRHKLP